MHVDLPRRVAELGTPRAEIESALLLSVARGVPLPRALVERGVLSERTLEDELGRVQGPGLRQLPIAEELSSQLPPSICRRLGAVPMRVDASSGVVELAVLDLHDTHAIAEFAFHLGHEVRAVRATLPAIEEAIRKLELSGLRTVNPRPRRRTPAFPHGAPRASSVPPPPVEEVPIPLIRRVPTRPMGQVSPLSPNSDPPPSSRPPLRLVPNAMPSEDGPRVSFPSTPPPSSTHPNGYELEGNESIAGHLLRPTPSTPPVARLEIIPDDPDSDEELPVFSPGPSTDLPSTVRPDLEVHGQLVSRGSLEEELLALAEETPAPDSETQIYSRASITMSLEEVLGRINAAPNRDALVEELIQSGTNYALRIAVFVVKKDSFQGWACNLAFGDPASVKKLVIPQDSPNILSTATAAGFYLGPIPNTQGHSGLISVMQSAGPDVAVHVARVAGKPAMVLVAEGLSDTMRGTRALGEMMRVAGGALGRILKNR